MPVPSADLADSFLRDGFAVIPAVLSHEEAQAMASAVDAASGADSALRREGAVYGMRDLLRAVPEVRRLAGSDRLVDLAEVAIGPGAFAVRGLWFDKTAEANWGVPWHQDLTIATRARVEAEGFGPWTIKAGRSHVRPPAGVLEGMVTLRVHLDDCSVGRGPLRVIPGSHRLGRLDAEATRDWLERRGAVECLAGVGDVVVMSPLILHASSPAEEPGRRRVIHLNYAARPLPGGVEWSEIVGRAGL